MGVYLGQSVYNDSQVTPEEVEELIEQNGKGVFWAQYNVTSYDDTLAAFDDGKIILCKNQNGDDTQIFSLINKITENPGLTENEFRFFRYEDEEFITCALKENGWTTIVNVASGTALYDRLHGSIKYKFGNLVSWAFGAPLINFSDGQNSYNLAGLPHDCLNLLNVDNAFKEGLLFSFLGVQIGGTSQQGFKTLNLSYNAFGNEQGQLETVHAFLQVGEQGLATNKFIIPTINTVFGPWNKQNGQFTAYGARGTFFLTNGGYYHAISDGHSQVWRFNGPYEKDIVIDLNNAYPNGVNQNNITFHLKITDIVETIEIILPSDLYHGPNNLELLSKLKIVIDYPWDNVTRNLKSINFRNNVVGGYIFDIEKPIINKFYTGSIITFDLLTPNNETFGIYGTVAAVIRAKWENSYWYIAKAEIFQINYLMRNDISFDDIIAFLQMGKFIVLVNPTNTQTDFYDVANFTNTTIIFISRDNTQKIILDSVNGWGSPTPV